MFYYFFLEKLEFKEKVEAKQIAQWENWFEKNYDYSRNRIAPTSGK